MNPRNEDMTMDPQAERELEALEAALAGKPVDPEHADLAALASELHEMRVAPPEDFAAALDEQASTGFPRRRHSGALLGGIADRMRGAIPRRRLLPALAGATAVVIVGTAVVVSSRGGRGDDQTPTLKSASPPQAAQEQGAPSAGPAAAAPATGEADLGRAESVAPIPPDSGGVPLSGGTGAVPNARNRQIERAAELTLGTEPEQVQDVSGEVFRVVGRHRGLVLSSSVRDGAEGEAGADFLLLIPSSRLSSALADLSALAEVRSRQESTQDITAPFVTARENLRDARAEAEGLLKQLAQADTEAERESVKAQLRIVRGRIAAFRSQVRNLERRADFSRVSLSVVTGDESVVVPSDENQWTIPDALGDAGRILAVAAGVALVTLAVMLPLMLFGAAAWLGHRAYLRRARQAALGG
ncbi:MAG: DUF4349 domain-containing protein [Actinomycetota bacterium]